MDDGGSFQKGRRGIARLQQQLLELDQDIDRLQQLIIASQLHGRPSLDLEQALLLLLEAKAVCQHGLEVLLQGRRDADT